MRDLTVTAIGEDRPGIVAAVTKVLLDLGCNLADCSMTRLSNQFAMILVVEAPDDVTSDVVEASLGPAAEGLDLTTTVREIARAEAPRSARRYTVWVSGADRPGIVWRVSRALADRGVNITSLISHVVGEKTYSMVLEVELPGDVGPDAVEADLQAVTGELGVDLTFRSAEA